MNSIQPGFRNCRFRAHRKREGRQFSAARHSPACSAGLDEEMAMVSVFGRMRAERKRETAETTRRREYASRLRVRGTSWRQHDRLPAPSTGCVVAEVDDLRQAFDEIAASRRDLFALLARNLDGSHRGVPSRTKLSCLLDVRPSSVGRIVDHRAA